MVSLAMNEVSGPRPDSPSSTGDHPRALFVLGAPRSGTTLIGNYIGSSPNVLNLGEYGGFHLAHNIGRSTLGALPGEFRDEYLADVAEHAGRFAGQLASDRGVGWYCDATPWNLSAASSLARQFDDAVFVLMLRHYAGTVQSLRRSYAGGFTWAGATWSDAAALWAASYSMVGQLPADRTIVVSYDVLSAEPRQTLSNLGTRLEEEGLDPSELRTEQFTVSHAPPLTGDLRPTIGHRQGDEIELRPIPSYDASAWSGDIQRMVWSSVRDVHHDLKARYPAIYRSPPPPQRLYAHDEIAGLVPFELGDAW
jgi:hypothetical protein